MVYGVDAEFPAIAIVNLGPEPSTCAGHYEKENSLEERDTLRENVRSAVAGLNKFISFFLFKLLKLNFVL